MLRWGESSRSALEAIVKIPQRSRPYCTTMQRSSGTQISGNRRPAAELSEVARARIIATLKAGVLKPEIAVDHRVNRLTVYDKLGPLELGYPTNVVGKPTGHASLRATPPNHQG